MNVTAHEQLIGALLSPDAWPWPVSGVELKTTHISSVLLADDQVIKLKRPVHYSFVDYSSREKRRQACLDEVRLNRLLTDDIYVGVVPILTDGHQFWIGDLDDSGDDAIEWASLMRRIDDAQLLDGQLERGEIPSRLADRLADRLVPFHRDRPMFGIDDPETMLQTQLEVIRENLDELAPFRGSPLPAEELDLIHNAMRTFIETHHDDLRARVAGGWIREGHGDLRAEHVVAPLEGPVQIFDCVEFNPDIRRADVASDLAFLLMDLFRLGAPEEELNRLIERYAAAGIDLPIGMLRFYWIHRALVRTKVHCLRLADLDDEARDSVRRKAVSYLLVAVRQSLTMRPAIIAMTGLSGTGKSTVARSLATALGADYLMSDEVRKSLSRDAGAADIYTDTWTTRTYDYLTQAARVAVSMGRAVVVDGTFLVARLREQVAAAARSASVPFFLVETVCDEDVVLRRLAERQSRGDSISDATADVYRMQRQRHITNPPPIPADAIHVEIDTTPEGAVSIDDALQALKAAGAMLSGIREDGMLT